MTCDLPGAPSLLSDELSRLTALYGSGLLDDGPQEALDALVELAASLLCCPAAMLTLVDRDTLHIRSASTGAAAPLTREITLCDHAIRAPEGLIVPDVAADPRFAGNPLIEEGLRFYAGVPVHAPDAQGTPRPIGALCVTDTMPRRLDERGRQALRRLGRLADVLVAARADAQYAVGIAVEHERLVAELARQHRVFAQTERLTGVGSWRLSLIDERIEWSESVYRIYGLPAGTPPDLRAALAPYSHAARGRVAAILAHAIEHRAPFDFEEDFRSASGGPIRVRCTGECEQVNGRSVALIGVFQDVTERYWTETALRRDAAVDALTGLANRAAFDTGLADAILRARAGATPLLLALIDLDGFKTVNDTLGHSVGDDVLRAVGVALRTLAIEATLVARVGGDEFALLVEDDTIDAAELAVTIGEALRVSAVGDGLTLACGGSVGVARLDDGEEACEFLARADVALYAAKRARVGDRRHASRRAA